MKTITLLTLVATTMASTLCAAEPQVEPVVDLTIGSGKRLSERFVSSPYGQTLQDPSIAGSNAMLNMAVGQGLAMTGLPPLPNLLEGIEGARLLLTPPSGPSPKIPHIAVHVQGSEQIISAIGRALGSRMGLNDNGDGTWTHPHIPMSVTVRSNTLELSVLGMTPKAAESISEDIALKINGAGFAKTITGVQNRNPQSWSAMANILPAIVGDSQLNLTFSPKGIQVFQQGVDSGVPTIPESRLAWIPETAQGVEVFTFSLREIWKAIKPELANSPAMPEIEKALAMVGCPMSADELAHALHGSLGISLSPGGMLPSVTVSLERSEGLDTLITWALSLGKSPIPAEGQSRFMELSGLPDFRGVMPTGMALARTKDLWMVSTDSILLEDILSGNVGKWIEGPHGSKWAWAKEAGEPLGFSWSSTRRNMGPLLTSLASFGSIGIAVDRRSGLPPNVGRELPYIAKAFGTRLEDDISRTYRTKDGVIYEGEGPIGGVPISSLSGGIFIPVIAGLTLPAIGSVRRNANFVKDGRNMTQIFMATFAFNEDFGRMPKDFLELAQEARLPAKLFDSYFVPGKPQFNYDNQAKPTSWKTGQGPEYVMLSIEPSVLGNARIPIIFRLPSDMEPEMIMAYASEGRSDRVKPPRAQAIADEVLRLQGMGRPLNEQDFTELIRLANDW